MAVTRPISTGKGKRLTMVACGVLLGGVLLVVVLNVDTGRRTVEPEFDDFIELVPGPLASGDIEAAALGEADATMPVLESGGWIQIVDPQTGLLAQQYRFERCIDGLEHVRWPRRPGPGNRLSPRDAELLESETIGAHLEISCLGFTLERLRALDPQQRVRRFGLSHVSPQQFHIGAEEFDARECVGGEKALRVREGPAAHGRRGGYASTRGARRHARREL